MGSSEIEQTACPPRKVKLSAYAIDETEVTITAFNDCIQFGNCEPIPLQCEFWLEDLVASGEVDEQYQSFLPAICITWPQAKTFCEFKGGRLPTEAEWEKAARGTEASIWPWGSLFPDCNQANFRFPSYYCEAGVMPISSYYEWKSAYGLWDTTGNAWEWVADYYDATYYTYAPDEDPMGPTEQCSSAIGETAGECWLRGLRGGSFNSTHNTTRGAARSFADPNLIDTNIGFRCAYDR